MGYDAYITRAPHWIDSEGYEIERNEWLDLIESDGELHLAPEYGQCFAVFGDAATSSQRWLDWAQGNVFTKNPDETTLRKMLDLAERLNAKVQGDEGETYIGVSPLRWIDPEGTMHSTAQRPWYQRLFGGGSVRR